ncbi:MAG: hypothetical protein P4L50_25140 [Anaerolineaceae bacterium]|nr:hypothetical protein [Anaerolineaceae bacterium]
MKQTWKLTLVIILVAAITACSAKSTPVSTNNTNAGTTNSGSSYVMPKSADTPTPVATLDSNAKSWSPIFIVTSQNPKMVSVNENGGEVDFKLDAKDSYAYKFRTGYSKADVVVDALALNDGSVPMAVVLTCRTAADYSKWYEFRVSLAGQYYIFYYDNSLKDKGQNPYVTLKSGTTDAMFPIKANDIKATCQGTTLALNINGQDVTSISDNKLSAEGTVGIGAASSYNVPVAINFQSLNITQP